MGSVRGGGSGAVRDVREGHHLCWSFDDREIFLEGLTDYIASGLRAGQRVACYLPAEDADESFDRVEAALGRAGLATSEPAFIRGTVEEAYLSGGGFDADERIDGYERMAQDARADGFATLRVIADASPVLADPIARAAWPAYELRADLLARRLGLVATCAYRTDRCDPKTLSLLDSLHSASTVSPRKLTYRLHSAPDGGLALEGEIDYAASGTIRSLATVAAPDVDQPTIDLSDLRFIDVAGVRAVVDAARSMAVRGRVTIKASPPFMRLWELLPFQDEPDLDVVPA